MQNEIITCQINLSMYFVGNKIQPIHLSAFHCLWVRVMNNKINNVDNITELCN